MAASGIPGGYSIDSATTLVEDCRSLFASRLDRAAARRAILLSVDAFGPILTAGQAERLTSLASSVAHSWSQPIALLCRARALKNQAESLGLKAAKLSVAATAVSGSRDALLIGCTLGLLLLGAARVAAETQIERLTAGGSAVV